MLFSKIALTVATLLVVLDSPHNGRLSSVVAADAADNFAFTSPVFSSDDAASAMIGGRRRHLELLQRLLQDSTNSSSDVCQSESDAAQSCLDANVGDANTTVGSECIACYLQKQEEALDDFRNNPTIECTSLNDNVCTPVSECTCLEPCDNEVSAMSDCSLKAAFAGSGIDLNCTIACEGTNVSLAEDDFLANSTDDFVGGLCAGEESAAKLCLESMGSSVDACYDCIDSTTVDVNVTLATTCSDLQVATCDRIDKCPCVEDCKTEMVALWNCGIDFSILDYPQLETCDQLEQCPSGGSGGTSGAAVASAWTRLVVVSWAVSKAVAAALY